MVQGSDVNNFFSGAQQGQNLMNMPLQNELLQQKVTQGQEQIGLAPMRREALQQQLDQGQNTLATQRDTLESEKLKKQIFGARKLVSAIGRGDEQGAINTIIEAFPDEAEQAREIAELRADPIGYGRDAQGGIDAFDAQARLTSKGNTQFGAQSTFKDSKGTLFFGTTKRDPNTGAVQSVLAAVDGSADKPVGAIEQTGAFGQTSAESIEAKGAGAKSTAIGTGEGQLETAPTVAAATDAAKAAIKLSTETFNRLEPLRANVANIDEAIALIDEGAATGPIISRLPSVRATSIKLDALQKKLGLDVIASTTFGALSEGEREFALSSALPKNLKGDDLKSWLQHKKETQTKLIDQLGEAASFLGTPGNTIADYIELTKVRDLEQNKSPSDTVQSASQTKIGRFNVRVK